MFNTVLSILTYTANYTRQLMIFLTQISLILWLSRSICIVFVYTSLSWLLFVCLINVYWGSRLRVLIIDYFVFPEGRYRPDRVATFSAMSMVIKSIGSQEDVSWIAIRVMWWLIIKVGLSPTIFAIDFQFLADNGTWLLCYYDHLMMCLEPALRSQLL